MSAEIISTNQTSQYLIGSGAFVVLLSDVTLSIETSTDPGFLADHDGACTLTVLGEAVTFGSAAVIGSDPSKTLLAAVTVGQGGLLQSLTNYGIEMRRSGSRIDNDGVISGGNGGVSYAAGIVDAELTNSGTISSLLGAGIMAAGDAGGTAPSLFEIVNTGLIEAETHGVSIGYESLDLINHGDIIAFGTGVALTDDPALDNALTLVNTGLIQGDTAAIDATGHADSVTNTGTLLGAVLLGDGNNLFDNSGTTTGAVTAGAGADGVTNTGEISGALGLGDGDNVALNAGRLAGLTAGSGADSFTNAASGVVAGPVDLGGGANTLSNQGHLAAGLTLGAGDDTLRNDGTIAGDVLLGDGNNTATVGGTVHGALTGGANPDTLEVRGQVDGDIILGGGTDSLRLKGYAGGDVDMGTGTDIVWLGADAETIPGTLDGGSGDDTLFARIDVEDVFNFEVINLKGGAAIGVTADAIANTVFGNRADNEIDGGDGDDQLFGYSGADTLIGGLGVDTLKGGRGADDLIGGRGADVLDGGRGRDVFAYESVKDSPKADQDRILDFERGRDTLDLSALVAGDIAWLGKGGFTGSGAAEARFKPVSGGLAVKIDTDGDGGADMVIVLEGLARMSEGDFFL